MRIIAGTYGGRTIIRPKTPGTRPMSDKVREALFNIVGSVEGMKVLDAYAGSGAIGLEALSRGARSVVLVEKAREPLKAIHKTIKSLGAAGDLTVIASLIEQAATALEQASLDLIVADPPYEAINVAVLNELAGLLLNNSLLVLSHSSRIDAPKLESMKRLETRVYGDSALSFYESK